MSYAVYTTEAVILRLIPEGEASLNVVFLTRELGKITARAQSARKEQSKMRMHLTRYQMAAIDVVRGKAIWRLTGISSEKTESVGKVFPKIASLVEHLVVGEMAHPELFMMLKSLREQEKVWEGDLYFLGFELFGAIKLLEKLGYWHGEMFPEIADAEVLKQCVQEKNRLVGMINESLSATQIMV